MPIECQRSTTGGKGNRGRIFERTPNVCAAGIPSAQANVSVADNLQQYVLQDEVDAIVSDAIIPPSKPRPLPPLRRQPVQDARHAGPFGEGPQLINPRTKTRFETIVEDLKETSYASYWKKAVGKVRDPIPMFPEGFDIAGTTFGKKYQFSESLYGVVMPKEPLPDKTPLAKQAGKQFTRNYCPSFNPDIIFGHRTFLDKRGTYAKRCLTDDRVNDGTGGRVAISMIHAKHMEENVPLIETALTPNNNIKNVPKGHSFGKLEPPDSLAGCFSTCELNPYRDLIRNCLRHLNTLRKCLKTKCLPSFFRSFYLKLKYLDKCKTGWLPNNTVYSTCAQYYIRFDSKLIEPLLSMWKAFDGSNIEYKTFVHVINHTEPSPELPKILDMPVSCLDFGTTYGDLTEPKKPENSLMAGIPTGRYFDMDYPVTPNNCCKADRTYLPQESDAKSCLCPSILTQVFVSHRDMYAEREPRVVRRVFEAAGDKLSDETFNTVWEQAKKYHSKGLVCYETFSKALESYNLSTNTNK